MSSSVAGVERFRKFQSGEAAVGLRGVHDGERLSSESVEPRMFVAADSSKAIAARGKAKRAEIAADAGVLDLALDTYQSVQPRNTIEAMLGDQLSAAHNAAMRLIQNASVSGDAVEMVRLSNAAARMMEVFQQGALTLHRLRTGGRQLVTVQHLTVAGGGQAVVAGNIAREHCGTGEDQESNG